MHIQLDYLLNTLGIDKLALLSYVGHLGYSFGETETLKDPFVELRAKMMSFKEMADSVAVDLRSV